MKRYYPLLLAGTLLLAQSCVTSYDKGLKEAGALVASGELRAAYPKLAELCKEKPQSDSCAQRDSVKSSIGAAIFDKVKASMDADRVDGLLPLPVIAAHGKDVQDLSNFGYSAEDLAPTLASLNAEKTTTDDGVTALIADSARLVDARRRKDAVDALNKAVTLDPDRKDAISGGIKKITDALTVDANIASEKDDWKTAAALLGDIKAITPDYPGIDAQLSEAQARDNLAFYLAAGEDAVKKEDFERALRLYQTAMNYPDSDAVRPLVARARGAAAQAAFKKGMSYYDSSQPYKAYQAFIKGQAYLKDIPFKDRSMVAAPAKVINEFLEGLSKTAEKEDDKGSYGIAYQLMKMVNDIDPNFSNAKKRLNTLQDKIAQRAIKGLAVIPFKSPSYSPEAGKIFSSNITFFLYKNLTPDIKVVEREAMETLLKEYEVKTAGQMDDRSRESILSLLGADYLLFGDVLEYKVESDQHEVVKSVRAQTRTEKVRNTQYDDWIKDKEKGVPDLPPAPPTYVDKPVIEEIKYKVAFYKKTGLVSMSYRVVDTKGKLLNASVVELKEDVEDESTDGVDAGDYKVSMKRASIPSDIELLRRVQEKAIRRIGDELKELFVNPENKYLEDAVRLEKDEPRESVERYSDVEIIYKKKGIDTKDVADKLGRLLDAITGI
ncbi:MAG: hypothetical protein HY894_02580 [Deltaproteobacteria bacterium]|nr:hypothetical protein [Deltaproteobacteria bacterium]